MSDAVTPKEQLTAYQRWELPAFDMVKEADTPPPTIDLPTASQLEDIHIQAHEEGYQAGYAEGMKQAGTEAQRITNMLESLNKELQQVDQRIAQELLNLALEIAKQMLQQALKIKPELLLNVVHAAINELPYFNQHAHLVLHTDDAELLRTSMGEQLLHNGWKIFEDNQIERGGCRVETAHSQIDATLPKRWQRVVASIGQDNAWLES
ncbi:flagellar assembly protein FliH [Candidatus Nitrotoga sp. AM1P]|uniref:flagellar assembly protein FliH n=1 Tax=Candidatus Nitrotoga sp. AM1P TaxID=2559597 RepID=UPI0010BABEB7|nr:flagellar assembly protein FliH [Candidatus Nitrotoga sp. AM1P]BBJ22498.1 flagellar assembly protein H [Candidatus Nitrotoga sp. AM1P]